jgi:hypothetical protein
VTDYLFLAVFLLGLGLVGIMVWNLIDEWRHDR